MNETNSSDNTKFHEGLKNLGLIINARLNYNKFVKAIETNDTEFIMEKLKEIDDIIFDKEKDQFESTINIGTKLYRARIIDPKDDNNPNSGVGITGDGKFDGYNEINSREPILGISSEGRNNIAGASYLYAASNPETACIEIKSLFGDLISLATFRVKQELRIIDVSSDKVFNHETSLNNNMSLGEFFTLLMFRFCEPVRNEKEYYVTQLISDHLRKTGIDGIAYTSYLSPGGINYTIFNCHSQKIGFEKSKILLHRQANHSFWDFNEEKAIFSNKEEKLMAYDKNLVDQFRVDWKKRFNNKP